MSKSVKAVIPLLKTRGITLHRSIGRGGQAYVFKATYRRDQVSQEMAVKVSITEEPDLWTELKNMRRLDHKNIIKCYDIWLKKRIPFLLFELAEGDMKSSYNAIKEKTKMLPSLECMRLWSKGLVSGLEFVHRSGLLHNDLKMANILMVREVSTVTDDPQSLVPKIADFGLSILCVTDDGNLIRGQNTYGTPNCSPPEGLILQEVEDMRLMDVWSLGLIIFQLVTDRSPFRHFSNNDFLDPQKVSARVDHLMTRKPTKRLSNVNHISEDERQEIRLLLNRFLEPNISQRESIDAIAKDIWFEERQRSDDFKESRII